MTGRGSASPEIGPVMAAGIALVLCGWAIGSTKNPPEWWQKQGEEILRRLWATAPAVQWVGECPLLRVTDSPALTASVRRLTPALPFEAEIAVSTLLCDSLAADEDGADVDALAGVIGHELAHLMLGHLCTATEEALAGSRSEDPQLEAYSKRGTETDADIEAARLMARAGYDPEGLVRALARCRNLLGERGAWEPSVEDHPSVTERLAALDEKREDIWHAALDFEVGTDLLRVGNYLCAQECFRAALHRFPSSPEIHCNFGYALLMAYYREAAEYLDALSEAGQPVPVGFAPFLFLPAPSRPDVTLRGDHRLIDVPPGTSRELIISLLLPIWQGAVNALRQATALRPDYGLAYGNLGFAYLIAPDRPRTADARAALEMAVNAEPQRMAWAVNNNLGVASMLEGRSEEALSFLRKAAPTAGIGASDFADAPVMNLFFLQASSARREDRHRAADGLETLLPRLPYGSAQWDWAYARYLDLCEELGRTPVDKQRLKPPKPQMHSSNLVRGSFRLYLGDEAGRVWTALGEPDSRVRLSGSSPCNEIICWVYKQMGLELVFQNARLIRAKCGRASGVTGWQIEALVDGRARGVLSVGDPATALDDVLGGPYDDAMRLGDTKPYRLYSSFRLAALVDGGRIAGMALAALGP